MGYKKDINKQIEELQLQAQTRINDTTISIDKRIKDVEKIYKKAEKSAEKAALDDKVHESLLADSAKFFSEYGRYKEALSRYQHLMTLRESLYGEKHPLTASAYHDIGEVYRILCNFPTALEYQIKSLDIRKDVLGEKHAETAESYNDTGLVYFYQGDYDKASELILKAKSIREEVLGVNHPDTAESFANMGLLDLKDEDYPNAKENFSKALEIDEKTLGIEHRKTAAMYYCLGYTYYQENNSESLNYYSKAIAVYEKVLGVNHPETALSYIGEGLIFYNYNGLEKAQELFTKALDINKKVFGEEHPYTASSYTVLGWLKYKMGEHHEAIEWCEKGLNITEKIFGLTHPDTAESYYNMGLLYHEMSDVVKAYEYYINAVEIYKKCSGSEFINKKIKEIEAKMEAMEVKDDEEIKGSRDLFLETLTKIGCQYEIDPDEGYISFGYQGEHFVASITNDRWFVRIWDTYWGHVELYDVDEFSRLRKAVNYANLNCSTITVYTINEEGKTVDLHCKSTFPFMPEMPTLEDYLRTMLDDFFNAHRLVGNEMAKLRDQEENVQTN